MKRVHLISPFNNEREVLLTAIVKGAKKANLDLEVVFFESLPASGRSIHEVLVESIETSYLVVCDVSGANPNVMYELGYAHALHRPVILVSSDTDTLPFDLLGMQSVFYSKDHILDEFSERLIPLLSDALTNPETYSNQPRTDLTINRVFISYSHKDSAFLERLLIHLKPLERQGLVDTWVDTRLRAGDRWKDTIESELERARIAILMVTADFLASDFIVNNELPPILSNAQSRGTKILPVVLKPCRFTRDQNLSVFQSVNDPRAPLIALSEADQETIYDDICSEVERAMSNVLEEIRN